MDQQQIKMNFLDEAEDCFHAVESSILNISSTSADSSKLDMALRATHSVKGGAGMMGFMMLSEVAHGLEDFFKILRVRYHDTTIDVQVETLLLQGVDQMRSIADCYRQGLETIPPEFSFTTELIFTELRQYLGELQQEDENFLLHQEDVSADLVLFEEGIEGIINNFATEIDTVEGAGLLMALQSTCEQLLICGQMADLSPFIELCLSIQMQSFNLEGEVLQNFCGEALKVWRRCQALVMRGSVDKLPNNFEFFFTASDDISLFSDNDTESITNTVDDFENNVNQSLDNVASLSGAFDEIPSEFAELASESSWDSNDIESLSVAFDEIPSEFAEFAGESSWDNNDIESLSDAFNNLSTDIEKVAQELAEETSARHPKKAPVTANQYQTVRVSAQQLQQLNNLFGKLVLERNRVNLRLEQLQRFSQLMNQRMEKLEDSNQELRRWYDKSSVAGMVGLQSALRGGLNEQFDALELDRYTDIHLISQGQIETIIQLKEVKEDINLGLQEINQGIQELNQTIRALQNNMTRIQMRPFSDLVKSFPRLIRDLSLQYGKQVTLKISGDNTLLDRTLIESLQSPMIHLIRNAFDHGIESPEIRQSNGKPTMGNITISALNRGTKTIITIEDDGQGINLGKIKQRLMGMGKSSLEIDFMSQNEVINSIFAPGFTTADKVTELSGRGVGMDVVRSNLEDIGGDIQVKTAMGKGTTFTLSVPFNSSILRVMIVESGGTFLAIPVNSVREVRVIHQGDNSTVSWQQQELSVIPLTEILSFNRPFQPVPMAGNPIINQSVVIIVGEGEGLGALEVERFWGEQEVTIRPIESYIPLPTGFISSLILGDGRVLPLVDPVALIQNTYENSNDLLFSSLPFTPSVNRSILIVDDSINIRRYLASTLEKAGYLVEEAKDGQEAVNKLLGGLAVEAVICDIEMPNLDGYGVLEEIKGRREFDSLPIIMLTSRSNEKHRQIAFNLGATDYFSKPYNEQELLTRISTIIPQL
ncbi:MAG: hybrid sensor histidine kinase/response regulator [Cyanobacterium sp. T60_A2020_053]|nr:hybrid sensor histidine kinase/response regulator [Cyanobacterium sp. T60_A2020_053]